MIALRGTALVGAAFIAMLACGGPTQVNDRQSLALIGTVEGDTFLLLDLSRGLVVDQLSSGLSRAVNVRAIGLDSTLLVLSAAGSLVGFDLNDLTVAWQEQLGSERVEYFDGQLVWAQVGLAFASDAQASLFLADSHRDGAVGVGMIDVSTRKATGWVGPLRVFKMLTAPQATSLAGSVVAFGTRSFEGEAFEDDRRRGQLYVLSTSPPGIRDSIRLLSAEDSAAGGLADMVLSPEGRYLYYLTRNKRLHKYDLWTRAAVGSLELPMLGTLATVPVQETVLIMDTWTQDYPGSGTLLVVESDLTGFESIDLTGAAHDAVAPALNTVAVSQDGRFAFVGAGTPHRGPLFGPQPGRVLVVDLLERRLSRIIETGTWAVRSILLLE